MSRAMELVQEAQLRIWRMRRQRRRENGLCVQCGARDPQCKFHGDKFCQWCWDQIVEHVGVIDT